LKRQLPPLALTRPLFLPPLSVAESCRVPVADPIPASAIAAVPAAFELRTTRV